MYIQTRRLCSGACLEVGSLSFHLSRVSSTNFDAIFEEFYHIIKTIANTHALLKLLSRKQKRLNLKSWITKGILISIKRKKKLYWSDYVNGNEVAKSLYQIYANKLKQIIRFEKSYTLTSSCNPINTTLTKLGKFC